MREGGEQPTLLQLESELPSVAGTNAIVLPRDTPIFRVCVPDLGCRAKLLGKFSETISYFESLLGRQKIYM